MKQGAVRAVSRVLPLEHMPRREPEVADLLIPLYEPSGGGAPPFLVQDCQADGSSQDWAILQCMQLHGAVEPVLYRHVLNL